MVSVERKNKDYSEDIWDKIFEEWRGGDSIWRRICVFWRARIFWRLLQGFFEGFRLGIIKVVFLKDY